MQADRAMQEERTCGFEGNLSGTTAVLIFLQGMRLFIANVGDSRAMMGQRGPDGNIVAVPLTQDAKPDDPKVTPDVRAH